MKKDLALYLIEILHQTTTSKRPSCRVLLLYLIEILHQTTTKFCGLPFYQRCILSKFYIKPQLASQSNLPIFVVSYRNSTSNHNQLPDNWDSMELYLIEILHQTTTLRMVSTWNFSLYLIEILHQTTTTDIDKMKEGMLYLIEILHQTTTNSDNVLRASSLYLIEILHQTTTGTRVGLPGALLYLIEILHQTTTGGRRTIQPGGVVSYRNSTSNHNVSWCPWKWALVVSYRNSTSNHNFLGAHTCAYVVVSYRNSTSNHNFDYNVIIL